MVCGGGRRKPNLIEKLKDRERLAPTVGSGRCVWGRGEGRGGGVGVSEWVCCGPEWD